MTHRNHEKLDPKLWEDAGLRPLTKREIQLYWLRKEWMIYNTTSEIWVKCPFGLRGLTICVPDTLPRLEQAQTTTQSLKEMLLEAKLKQAEARIEELGAALAKSDQFILEHHEEDFYGNPACRECFRMSDDTIKEGFQCAYHEALSRKDQPA